MPSIEIQYQSGPAQQQKLKKTEPFSIGRHSSNDICIDEDGVAVIHCRISWNGKKWEVVAGDDDNGVEVNGTFVQNMRLKNGDLLRVGSVDITFRGLEKPTAKVAEKDEYIGLQKVTDDEMPILKRATDTAREMGGSSKSDKPADREKKSKTRRADENAGNELFQFDDDDDHEIDARIFEDASKPDDFDEVPPPAKKEDRVESEKPKASEKPQTGEKPQEAEPLFRQLKMRLAGNPVRPGEQDIVRSPLVLWLGGGSLVLLLAAVSVWLIIGRDSAQKQFDAAQSDLGSGNYKQAIDRFKSFIQGYPKHEYTNAARYGLGWARIELPLSSATPKWAQGMENIQIFLKQHRDRPGFADEKKKLRTFAEKIALGAVKSAETAAKRPDTKTTGLRELLDVSREAEGLLNRLHPPDEQPVELQRELADLLWKAEQAIEKKESFLAAVDAIEQAIKDRLPREALSIRKDLLTNYSEFRSDRRLSGLLTEILDLERSLVTSEDINRDAVKNERNSETPRPLSLTRHTHSGSSEESVGQTVIAVAKDCCYGIDTATGKPLWRRVTGIDSPFFPESTRSSVEGLLLFDTNHRELTLIDRRTGKLEWRQPIEEEVTGPPLVHEGQIYLPTLSGRLYQIVLESGKVTKRLTFSKQLLTPPVLVRHETQIVVAGRESVLYTLSLRPMNCLAVTFSDHQAGAVEAPLLTMGPFVLMTENHQIGSCRLRVFDTSDDDQTLKETATDTIPGRVHHRPVIRGSQLFVTSSPERITAYTVSKDENQPPLVRITETQVSGEHSGPLFLKTGADGQLWMAGSAFRSFQLKTDTIAFDEANRVAVGISTQPLQLVDRYFFLGRRQPYHRAVLFTPVERDQLTSHWKTVLGSSPIAMITTAPNSAICVTETGDVYDVRHSELNAGGFRLEAADSLPLKDGFSSPIEAAVLSTNQLALSVGGPEPRLWVVHTAGRIVRTIKLPQPLEANPILLDAGMVLPVPGRLTMVRSAGGSSVKEYPIPLEKGSKPRWAHLVKIDGDELLAINNLGRLMRIQYRASQVAHLAEVDRLELGQPIDVPPAISDGRLVVADAGGHLKVFDLATMDMLSDVKLDAKASSGLSIVNGQLYVETVDHRLSCFSMEGKLQPIWTIPLEDSPLAGAPLAVGNQIVVARQNGSIWTLDPSTGEIQNRLNVGQPAGLGPQKMGKYLVLPTIDGSLHRIEAVLTKKQAEESE